MKLSKKEIQEIINQEIIWCKDHPLAENEKEWHNGFLNGLEQAKTMLSNACISVPKQGINIVWIVGLYIPIEPVSEYASIDGKWEIEGVYYTEAEARSACKVRNNFYAPIEIGKGLSGIDLEWPGLVYPLIEEGA